MAALTCGQVNDNGLAIGADAIARPVQS